MADGPEITTTEPLLELLSKPAGGASITELMERAKVLTPPEHRRGRMRLELDSRDGLTLEASVRISAHGVVGGYIRHDFKGRPDAAGHVTWEW